MVLSILCALVALAIIGLVVVVAVFDKAGHLAPPMRVALLVIAAGLVGAGPDRFRADPGPGLGDLVFLLGLLAVLVLTYWKRLAAWADAWDGELDGRVGFLGHPSLDDRVASVRQQLRQQRRRP